MWSNIYRIFDKYSINILLAMPLTTHPSLSPPSLFVKRLLVLLLLAITTVSIAADAAVVVCFFPQLFVFEMKRPRSVASHSVSVDDYKSALRAWKRAHSGSWESVLGPNLAEDLRGVNPPHIITLASLFTDLINSGLDNAMVVPSKLTQALRQIFGEDGNSGKTMGLDLYAHKVQNHIRHSFNMLRVIYLDEHQKIAGKIQKSKTFLRKCSTADFVIIRSLTSKLEIDVEGVPVSAIADAAAQNDAVVPPVCDEVPSAVQSANSGAISNAGDSAPDQELPDFEVFKPSGKLPSWAVGLDLEETSRSSSAMDFPTFNFGKLLGQRSSRASSRSASIASTKLYDDDAEIVLPSKIKSAPTPAPITPSSKTRKKDILGVRAVLKSESAQKVVKPADAANAVAKAGPSAKGLDVPLFRPKLSMSKPGVANCRVELCCFDDSGKRIFVFGSVVSTYGPGLQDDAQALKDYISKNPGISKRDALAYRDSLRAARLP